MHSRDLRLVFFLHPPGLGAVLCLYQVNDTLPLSIRDVPHRFGLVLGFLPGRGGLKATRLGLLELHFLGRQGDFPIAFLGLSGQ